MKFPAQTRLPTRRTTKTMTKNRKYSNGTITVVWQPAECIHSGRCFTTLRRVFDPSRRPWVDMTGAESEEIIDVVESCPTRALTFFWNDPTTAIAGREDSPKLFDRAELPRLFSEAAGHDSVPATRVAFRSGGPLVVKGDFEIVDETGAAIGRGLKMASFCRCGQSDNQPFCDGAHFKAGFRR